MNQITHGYFGAGPWRIYFVKSSWGQRTRQVSITATQFDRMSPAHQVQWIEAAKRKVSAP